jgi:hypothetical protein
MIVLVNVTVNAALEFAAEVAGRSCRSFGARAWMGRRRYLLLVPPHVRRFPHGP